MMKRLSRILILVISLGIFGCSTTATIGDPKVSAESEFEAGNYSEALQIWEKEIADFEDSDQEVPKELYAFVGNAAFALGDLQEALRYYELAQYHAYVDEMMYDNMLSHYRKIDNLSKEITALEAYVKNNPNGLKVKERNQRLFQKYVESENWELGYNLWPTIEKSAENNNSLIEGYLVINRELKNTALSDQLAKKLLKRDAKNTTALDWLAFKFYWKAENKYQAEINKYEQNKTRKQYAILIEELDKVTADFKKSLNYYLRLYKIKPDKRYALLLGNIYARMNDKEKSQFWKERSK